MYQRRRARVLLAVLVLVSLVLITVDFRTDGPLERLRAVATTVFEPVQNGIASAIRPIGSAVSGVGDLFELREENERLEARLARLEERWRSLQDLERQNRELQLLLGIEEELALDTVPARVVALAPSNYEWTITIDAGTEDGVRVDQPVINGNGLVGRVIQVTRSAARVLLAIDPNFTAAARDARLGETGPIEGQGGGLMLFQPLDPEVELTPGDEVLTSSFRNGIFPAGIPIGTIEDVGEATTLLNRDVLVRPYVDFTRLDVVLVVQHLPVTDVPPPSGTPSQPLDPPRLVPESPSPSPRAPASTPTPEPTEGGEA